jgi:hypothetical protein
MESGVSALPASVPWLGDALWGSETGSEDAVEVLVRGQGGHELSTSRPGDESSGAVSAFRGGFFSHAGPNRREGTVGDGRILVLDAASERNSRGITGMAAGAAQRRDRNVSWRCAEGRNHQELVNA